MIIVFDLDDTLYEELTFVYSGYQSIANYLSPLLNTPASQIFVELKSELQIQRNGVFDRFLNKHNIKNQQLVKRCLSLYRGHTPNITLYPEAIDCLDYFKKFPIYVVTDGNKIVQKKKFLALGLNQYVRKCLCTYAYGIEKSKPSPYCFEKICQWEKVPPASVVYIADNPHKDFVGISPLGFKTIRVLTGPYRHIKVSPSHDAGITINSLAEIKKLIARL